MGMGCASLFSESWPYFNKIVVALKLLCWASWGTGVKDLFLKEEVHFFRKPSFLLWRFSSTEKVRFSEGGSFLRRKRFPTRKAHF